MRVNETRAVIVIRRQQGFLPRDVVRIFSFAQLDKVVLGNGWILRKGLDAMSTTVSTLTPLFQC